MRSLTRLGVAFAATALAGSTALAGAGIAGAEEAATKPVLDSASSVSVSGKGKNTKISYTNKSGQDLFCSGIAAPGSLISELYNSIRSMDPNNPGNIPEGLDEAMTKAAEQGKVGGYGGVVENGKTVDLTTGYPGGPDFTLTDGSFVPAAVVVCYGNNEYFEVEVSPGAGVPAGLGSLDSALAGIGSSGSVAKTTGSLGS
ncbi:hypothetical protein [Dietzia sp. ANT_WB102]|uniref:hypothetical protein n=1 Tax=Dietzia sp. ANT_WB102 TaxID=2597345 RepID=UPI0011EDC0C4|nr:hypothetical protein [Dietzia sp. ANT_WB102]KAA0918750.1 hypothetical protein FQ137_05350 [Dietzia sp. ANT_WB102]